jgi:hypothetical protein
LAANNIEATVFPNPTSDFVAIQTEAALHDDIHVAIMDMTGRLLQSSVISAGSTISYIDTRTFYSGDYMVRLFNSKVAITRKVSIVK